MGSESPESLVFVYSEAEMKKVFNSISRLQSKPS